MRSLITLSASLILFLAACSKDPNTDPPAANYPFPGTYVGTFTTQSNGALANPQDGTAIVTNNGSNYSVKITVNGSDANLTATLGSDNRLSFGVQNLYNTPVTGKGEMTDSGQMLSLTFESSGLVAGSTATFRGKKQ